MAKSGARRVNGYIVYQSVDDGRRGHVNQLGVFVTDYLTTPNPAEHVVVFHNDGGNTSKSFPTEIEAEVFAQLSSPEEGYGRPVWDAWIDEVWPEASH